MIHSMWMEGRCNTSARALAVDLRDLSHSRRCSLRISLQSSVVQLLFLSSCSEVFDTRMMFQKEGVPCAFLHFWQNSPESTLSLNLK